jgi:hypothetical protein
MRRSVSVIAGMSAATPWYAHPQSFEIDERVLGLASMARAPGVPSRRPTDAAKRAVRPPAHEGPISSMP